MFKWTFRKREEEKSSLYEKVLVVRVGYKVLEFKNGREKWSNQKKTYLLMPHKEDMHDVVDVADELIKKQLHPKAKDANFTEILGWESAYKRTPTPTS